MAVWDQDPLLDPVPDRFLGALELVLGDLQRPAPIALAWAQPRPECPGHPHPAVPELIDGESWWVCLTEGHPVARFGELH